MEYIKVQVRLVATLAMLLLFTAMKGQTADISAFISKLYDDDRDSAISIKNENTVYILITNKNCLRCFNEVCGYLSKSRYSAYKVHGIICTKKDYAALNQQRVYYMPAVACAAKFYFSFIEDFKEGYSNIFTEPSPQVIIKDSRGYTYIPYAAVMKLLKE